MEKLCQLARGAGVWEGDQAWNPGGSEAAVGGGRGYTSGNTLVVITRGNTHKLTQARVSITETGFIDDYNDICTFYEQFSGRCKQGNLQVHRCIFAVLKCQCGRDEPQGDLTSKQKSGR